MSTLLKLRSRPGLEFLLVRAGGKNTRVKPKDGGETFLVENSDILVGSQQKVKTPTIDPHKEPSSRTPLILGQRVLRPSPSPEHEFPYLIGTITQIEGSLVKINNRTVIHESRVTIPSSKVPHSVYTEDADPFIPLVDTRKSDEPPRLIKFPRKE